MRADRAAVSARNEVAHALPNFIVIGAMKGGTTSLYHYLRDHGQVFMPAFKELDFFVGEANYCRGLAWYSQQFSDAGGARARGEASTTYTQYPVHGGVPERIARVLPGVRLIYVIRDPIERIRSHYEHLVLTGVEKSPPQVAVLENPIYLACSKYAMQLEQYLAHFPREQILIVTSEALRFDRRATVQQIYEFLDLDATQVPDVVDTEFYRTQERPVYSPAVLWARRFAARHMLQARLARTFATTTLARRRDGDPGTRSGTCSESSHDGRVLAPELRALLVDLLGDDVARLRRYMPADFDGWGYT